MASGEPRKPTIKLGLQDDFQPARFDFAWCVMYFSKKYKRMTTFNKLKRTTNNRKQLLGFCSTQKLRYTNSGRSQGPWHFEVLFARPRAQPVQSLKVWFMLSRFCGYDPQRALWNFMVFQWYFMVSSRCSFFRQLWIKTPFETYIRIRIRNACEAPSLFQVGISLVLSKRGAANLWVLSSTRSPSAQQRSLHHHTVP